ncbi:C39 family peptidase [Massilia sp. R2A-15]|uniref:C39 family peptidase n=1 Tax=Massilia sp. R2A-15 TaxID=3064278 RepID=UPI0027331535|nr:C39 family peptidase [Massilia sp. R2A-15]WLI90042.1 C39 family peptidase [Massilia sp. R2A-15]
MNIPRLAAALLLSCAAQQAGAIDLPGIAGARYSVPVASMKEMRFKSTLRQQFDFSCGSAAAATLLTHHYGVAVSEQAVFEQMYLHGDQRKIRKEGFSLLDIKRFLAAKGFQADGFKLPLQKLIDARLPAIVLVSEKGYNHFVVIKGAAEGRILIGDPANGTRSLPREAFEQIWRNKLLFVIHGDARTPAFNRLADWRAAPHAPLGTGINRDGLSTITMAKRGPGDY